MTPPQRYRPCTSAKTSRLDTGALRYTMVSSWGRYGFDDGNETCGACRDGSQSRKSKAANY